MWMSFSVSPSMSRVTGMPVQRLTTSAMSSSSTSSFTIGSSSAASRSLELGFERRQLAVADLGHALEVALALGALGLHAQLVDGAGDLLHALERLLLLRPARGELVPGRLRVGELALERLAHLLRLLRHRGQLDLQLAHAPLGLVELQRRRVDLHAHARGGLVHEVDRLVGEEAAGDVAVGEHGRGHERGVADAHAVVRLVALLEAAEDGDRVRGRRLADEDRLEAALERRVLLDVLAVLVERRRADGAQLAAREHRLQHVARRRRRPRRRPRRRSCAARR